MAQVKQDSTEPKARSAAVTSKLRQVDRGQKRAQAWALGLGPWAVAIAFSTIAFAQNWPSFRGANAAGVADGHPHR